MNKIEEMTNAETAPDEVLTIGIGRSPVQMDYKTISIQHPTEMPKINTLGRTYLLPQYQDPSNPVKCRSIVCLPSTKVFIGCLANKIICKTCEVGNIFAEQQKG